MVLAVMTTVCVVSLIIAGVASLVSLADRIHPIAGTIVFWAICLTAGLLALYYAIAYTRLPAALGPPEEESGPKYDAYLQTSPRASRGKPTREDTRSACRHKGGDRKGDWASFNSSGFSSPQNGKHCVLSRP